MTTFGIAFYQSNLSMGQGKGGKLDGTKEQEKPMRENGEWKIKRKIIKSKKRLEAEERS
jgi:hypothetical protein